ncbi:type II toxin-antitoxin system PemK/MazF family toxin [Limnochorda pilosa]|uniref:Toxin-antitoxin system toxin component MazF family n=1 Tax=Limnochorda pilosa TaxID=1555112 RepID=A0A0K2SNV6_LIMPI|nr:type II toxin-antitoxin system PemK/MazF family toxin [Limnochorda pilosa]BAS28672.1 toxin-antitoxin system toxin component MazF family [Limnochorda pilosa]
MPPAEPGRRVRRGEVYFANLNPVLGSEQGGVRPVLVVQNDAGNRRSATVIVAPVTSRLGKARLPTHVVLPASGLGLEKDSVILLEQIRTLARGRLKGRVGAVDAATLQEVDRALGISLGLKLASPVPPGTGPDHSGPQNR